jgi:hypothetical protein
MIGGPVVFNALAPQLLTWRFARVARGAEMQDTHVGKIVARDERIFE